MRYFKLLLIIMCFLTSYAVKAQTKYVEISTPKGVIIVMLYDATPRHRDNFLKAIRRGTYKGSTFNRVIKNFVSQAGELDETILSREEQHPNNIRARIPAEINAMYFHKKGALGAGRNDNPEKSSYINQIYLVQGKKQTDGQLDLITFKTGRKFSDSQRITYKTIGGTPGLDGDYTVFGEIVSGLEVADEINEVMTNSKDLPLTPVHFTLRILNNREVIKFQPSN